MSANLLLKWDYGGNGFPRRDREGGRIFTLKTADACPILAPMIASPSPRKSSGRPSKFGEPSRPVTMTLPLRILSMLETVDADRAKAITRCVETLLASSDRPPVETHTTPSGRSLVLVADSRYLRDIPWLNLVEISPGRNLLSLQPGISIEKFEVTLGDLLVCIPKSETAERKLVHDLLECLREPRRKQAVATEKILVITPSA